MARQYPSLDARLTAFITAQKIFFVATAAADGRVNLSPKGMDSLRVLGGNRVIWLNVTGSGNETAAHLAENPRMTLMFCAFDGVANILRLYGTARTIHRRDADWGSLIGHFPPLPGARQIFDLTLDLAQTSCGMAVPFMDYAGERDHLNDWARKQGDAGINAYWQEKNQRSLDGLATGIFAPPER